MPQSNFEEERRTTITTQARTPFDRIEADSFPNRRQLVVDSSGALLGGDNWESRFRETQIVAILKEGGASLDRVPPLTYLPRPTSLREYSFSKSTWRGRLREEVMHV